MPRAAAATVTSFEPCPSARSKPRPRAQRASAVARDASPSALAATAPAAAAADHADAQPEALGQPDRLGEVARGDVDLGAAGPQALDHRVQDEDVRAVRQVDPDAHEA